MPRENSFTDSEGRSLTPDLEEEQQEPFDFEVQPRPGVSSSPPGVQPTYSIIPPTGTSTQGGPSSPTSPVARMQSVKSPGSRSKTTRTSHWTRPSAKDKFRLVVRKVIAMHRGTRFMTVGGDGEGPRVGAEPGVDPRRASADMQYGHIRENCVIEITDYSSVRTSVGRMDNQGFVELMYSDLASQRPGWVRVRWINIAGVSWDVIKAVSLRYDLHPLALEDIFHGNSQTRSKADYYLKHLFLRVLCHQLSEHDAEDENTFIPDIPRSTSPEPYDKRTADDEKTLHNTTPSPHSLPHTSRKKHRRPILPFHNNDMSGGPMSLIRFMRRDSSNVRVPKSTLDALKKGERVDVDVAPMFLFLFRDGTVISIHPKANLEFTSPIMHRLRQPDTVLRQSPDPSILVHAILDLIVDRALQVVDAYHDKINKFERDVLIRPKVKTIRHLHIMSGDLILHKRTLEPIKTLVYGLRRYDVDRCAALIDTSDPASAKTPVVGFMSHKSKIYLADVFDHMEYILTSLDMFASIAENLIGYSFNSASYDMNIVMRRLTLVTIIGLPLTLLTGYFGMNFTPFWAVDQNSDALFWKIAIPVLVVTVTFALWQDFTNLYHYMEKKLPARRITQLKIKEQ